MDAEELDIEVRANEDGSGAVLSLFARAEWRSRWRSHLLSSLLLAVTVAVTLGLLLGAARAESAYDRLRTATRASDVYVSGEDTKTPEATAAEATRAGFTRPTIWASPYVRPKGSSFIPTYDLIALSPGGVSPDRLDTAVVRHGRRPGPGEVALSEPTAKRLRLGVGDRINLESMSEEWKDTTFSGGDAGPPDGPAIALKVVGLVRSPLDFGRWKVVLYLGPGIDDQYGSTIWTEHYVFAGRGGSAGAEAGLDAQPSFFADDPSVDNGLATIAAALRLLAAAIGLAGLSASMLFGLRLARTTLSDHRTLSSLGWTRRQVWTAYAAVTAPWSVAGIGLGVVAGLLGSPRALIGLARRADPVPTHVLAPPFLVLVVFVGALAVGAATIAVSSRRAIGDLRSPRPTSEGLAVRPPLPVVLGVRHALMGDARGGGRSSRTALAVVTLGAAIGIGALTVSASIGRLQRDPQLYGIGAATIIDSGEALDVYDRALPLLRGDQRVAALAGVHTSFSVTLDSKPTTAQIFDVIRGDIGSSVVRGVLPSQPDEVALGEGTLEDLRKRVGDQVVLSGTAGRKGRFRVVGAVLFPEGDFAYDKGVALSAAGAERLVDIRDEDQTQIHQVALRWAPGVDTKAAERSLTAAGFGVLPANRAVKPPVVTNLGEVESLPRFLTVFVGLMALVTLGYALASTSHLRRGEFAILRALGVARRANAMTMLVHGVTLVLAGLVIATPLGLAGGRQTWAGIAGRANVVVATAAPLASIGVLAGVGLLGAIAAAVWSARRGGRSSPADVLRSP